MAELIKQYRIISQGTKFRIEKLKKRFFREPKWKRLYVSKNDSYTSWQFFDSYEEAAKAIHYLETDEPGWVCM